MNKLVNTSLPLVTLQTARHARQTLEAGITTVRDLGCRDFIDLAFREAVGSGLAQGPRMLCAGQMICITGGHGWQIGCVADGPDQVRRAVRLQAKAGVDLVKFMVTGGVLTRNGRPGVPQLTVEETTAGVEEAHKAGLKTAAHVQSLEGVRNAVAAGIDSLEHCVGLDDEIIEEMVKQGTFAVPTLSAPFNILEAGAASGIPQEFIDKTERRPWSTWKVWPRPRRPGSKSPWARTRARPSTPTDATRPSWSCWTRSGSAPLEAVTCATSASAELLGVGDVTGAVTPGRQADLLIVAGNPLDDLTLLADPGRIRAVYKSGVKVR